LKINYQVLIIFGTNITDTTCYQMTVHFCIKRNRKPEKKHPQHYQSYRL